MKKLFKILLVSLVIMLASCEKEKEKEQIIGGCSNPPKLSTEKLIFDKKGGTKEVTISEKYRFGIEYKGKNIDSYNESENLKIIRNEKFTTYKHIDFTLKTYDFKIIVIMNENKGQIRELVLSTNAGNCFTGFTVEQKGN